jgi:ABC-type polysaccharide/polyol phosphate transport system ATPase subunit
MDEIVLRAEHLTKYYLLGGNNLSIAALASNFAKSLIGQGEPSGELFCALNDVSFELKRGEVMGIIGRNGAGKSTLLKILSEVTTPSSGKFQFYGTRSSILEIGVGFHPDLTGRENVFFNAAMLGISRKQVIAAYDEIVEFSGVGTFIDQPVKQYSSGMFTRLAFAVSSHLRADVLILDEVLSVGDEEFRLRSLQKIEQLARQGSAILFITHNLNEIQQMCHRCMVLDQGRTQSLGEPSDQIGKYLEDTFDRILSDSSEEQKADGKSTLVAQRIADDSKSPRVGQFPQIWDETERNPISNETIRLVKVSVHPKGKADKETLYCQDCIQVTVDFEKKQDADSIQTVITIFNQLDTPLLASCEFWNSGVIPPEMPAGIYQAVCEIPANYFQYGTFFMSVGFGKSKELSLYLHKLIYFKVHFLDDETAIWRKQNKTSLTPSFDWKIQYQGPNGL